MGTRPHCGMVRFIPAIPAYILVTATCVPQHRGPLCNRHSATIANGVSGITMTLPAKQLGHGNWGPLRAITAVIALYAFVLHAVLSGLVPLPSAASHGLLCLGQTDDLDSGTPNGAHTHHLPCCTVAGSMLHAALPEIMPRSIIWPTPVVCRHAWQRGSSASARGPPGSIPHPRGPPFV